MQQLIDYKNSDQAKSKYNQIKKTVMFIKILD
uniref:Uncharacterized protein n=1 Tax=Anguilla anguilla TaxID=7936 RepID=A0A0E9RFJ9_ANGAN